MRDVMGLQLFRVAFVSWRCPSDVVYYAIYVFESSSEVCFICLQVLDRLAQGWGTCGLKATCGLLGP
jgi:hypothetical protein